MSRSEPADQIPRSPTDSIAVTLERIRETRDLNIVIADTADRARDRAASGKRGELTGATLAVKDNIDIAGVRTTQGSVIADRAPARTTAPVVAAIESAGALTVAKVNLHEFAYGVSSANPHYGAVGNPLAPGHIPGGSSGGSAAAIAAGIARIALGTDTAGSVRIPAACTGLVGLRPRQGMLDSSGVAPLAPSYDTAGPMAATVADVAATWRALMTGAASRSTDGVRTGSLFDRNEPPPADTRPALAGLRDGAHSLRGVRLATIGLSGDLLARLGAQIVPLDLDVDTVLDAFWPAFRTEVTRTHARTFPSRAGEYDPNVAAKLAAAAGADGAQYCASIETLQAYRSHLITQLNAREIDVIVTPTLDCAVPRVGTPEPEYRDALGRYAAPFSALNLPALAFGNLQFVGRTEADVLALGLACESAGMRPFSAPLA